ncbi:MAG: polysaccharide biosynthesis/export family protein [bacterium]
MNSIFKRLVRLFVVPTIFFYLFAAVIPASLEAATSASSTPTPAAYPSMLIGPGDLLDITVLGYDPGISSGSSTGSSAETLPSTFLVDSDGKILFPFIGQVSLGGLSQIQASELLMKKLKKYMKYPQATVLIQTSNTYNVSVLGDVTHPGQFPIRGKPDVVSMIAQAGGPAPNPDLGGVLLTRGDKKIQINLGKYLTDKNFHKTSPTVYPGDVIYVPDNPWPTLKDVGLFLSIIISGAIAASVITNTKN